MRKTIEEIGHRLGFTASESVVILFLCLTLIIGSAISLHSSRGAGDARHDYAVHDSVFRAAAEATLDVPSPVTDSAAAPGPRLPEPQERRTPTPHVVNINTAAARELESLPGVGPSTAAKIIEYRNAKGKFRSIEDIMKVKSIGPKKFERMKPYIRVQ